jgi:ubiquinol-cytochrome c reductase cytochrome b subunit
MFRRVGDWLDVRTGYRRAMAALLDEPVPGGASFAYVFGSVLTFVLVNQLVTGVLLALYYSPSASQAWGSVAYIQDQVTMGWFVRGMHAHGASAMVIVAGLHLLQTAIYGAYKKPREVNWFLGVAMLGLILAFALTGYLLPWDQKGYWATKVATGIAGGTPFIGDAVKELLQGGNEYGNLTLTRFFALHTFVLPATLLGLLALHLALFRRHGVTPRWGRSPEELARRTQRFSPHQLLRDMVAIAVAFAILAGITQATGGAELGAPADPSSPYNARPEWYFLPLFQTLKYFGGAMERVAALGAPVVVLGVLVILPLVDRGADRSPWRRLPELGAIALLFIGAGTLMGLAKVSDARDATYQKRVKEADDEAVRARKLALVGVPPAGGTAVYENDPQFRGRRIFRERCQGCHAGKERKGPELAGGYNSRAWLAAYLVDPDGARFFGPTKGIHGMKPTKYRGADLDALVEMLYAETGAEGTDAAKVEAGRKLFDTGPCSDCHSRDGTSVGEEGPNLGGRGGRAWLVAFIGGPNHPRFFGEKNEMPVFKEKLRPEEIAQVAEFVAGLRDAKPSLSLTGP